MCFSCILMPSLDTWVTILMLWNLPCKVRWEWKEDRIRINGSLKPNRSGITDIYSVTVFRRQILYLPQNPHRFRGALTVYAAQSTQAAWVTAKPCRSHLHEKQSPILNFICQNWTPSYHHQISVQEKMIRKQNMWDNRSLLSWLQNWTHIV